MARFRFGDGIYLRLMKPAWGTHMTIIRREVPNKFDWDEWQDREIEFTYNNLRTNRKHVWLDCECDEMLEFRTNIGLPMIPEYPLHVTVGVMPGDI